MENWTLTGQGSDIANKLDGHGHLPIGGVLCPIFVQLSVCC